LLFELLASLYYLLHEISTEKWVSVNYWPSF